jgi:hypothetical protein
VSDSRVGKLPARYSFLLNPYNDVRLSKCPQCDRTTHLRKFPLVIHVDGWGMLVLGKTCRYCTPCELIMAHQDELERELTKSMAQLAPNVIGNEYLVLGTMERKIRRQGLHATPQPLRDMLEHMADFRKHLDLNVEGGWRPD